MMLLKSNPVIAFVVVATLYATALLYTTGFFRAHKSVPVEASRPPQPLTPPSPPAPPELAIATFLTGQASDDTYFNSTRLLAFQLLHDPPTRLTNPNITFVVLCGHQLHEEKKDILREAGATVIPLDDVQLPSWIHVGEQRWSEQFTKLRVFELTQYKRVLYIDADYFIMEPMDAIFEYPIITSMSRTLFSRSGEIKEDEGELPEEWLFAARSENGGIDGFDHQVPPLTTNYANGGFWITAPDHAMFNHLMRVMQCEDRFRTTFMEQDMLNYVFRRDGPMPWRELDWQWSANFVNEADVEHGVRSLHGKFWKEGPQEVRDRWQDAMEAMIQFEQES